MASAIVAGVEDIHIKPGTKLLYLGAAAGTWLLHAGAPLQYRPFTPEMKPRRVGDFRGRGVI